MGFLYFIHPSSQSLVSFARKCLHQKRQKDNEKNRTFGVDSWAQESPEIILVPFPISVRCPNPHWLEFALIQAIFTDWGSLPMTHFLP